MVLADAVFNFIAAPILLQIAGEIESLDLAPRWRGPPGPFSEAGRAPGGPQPPLTDTTFADDIALMAEEPDRAKLGGAAAR
eukprot:11212569-Lingulodinium_polyedra.AAC.1